MSVMRIKEKKERNSRTTRRVTRSRAAKRSGVAVEKGRSI
jgi:hypothetical protein